MEHSGYVDLLEEDVIITNVREMEERGYYLINSNPEPSKDLVKDIEDSIGKNELCGNFQSDTVPTKYFDWEKYGKEIKQLWKNFMNIGINVALPPSILLLLIANGTAQLDVNYLSRFEKVGDTVQQEPIVVRFTTNTAAASLKRSHPCRDGLSIWRPIRKAWDQKMGCSKFILALITLRQKTS